MSTTVDHAIARGGEPISAVEHNAYLQADGYSLTPRRVSALRAHLLCFTDTLTVTVVDPLTAIDAHMRFDGGSTGWMTGRTAVDIATAIARAEQIARDYFGARFLPIPW